MDYESSKKAGTTPGIELMAGARELLTNVLIRCPGDTGKVN